MDPIWSKLLSEVPLVGVFIIYTIYIIRIFLDELAKHDAAFNARNTAVIEVIQELNKSICGKIDRIKQPGTARSKRIAEKKENYG